MQRLEPSALRAAYFRFVVPRLAFLFQGVLGACVGIASVATFTLTLAFPLVALPLAALPVGFLAPDVLRRSPLVIGVLGAMAFLNALLLLIFVLAVLWFGPDRVITTW